MILYRAFIKLVLVESWFFLLRVYIKYVPPSAEKTTKSRNLSMVIAILVIGLISNYYHRESLRGIMEGFHKSIKWNTLEYIFINHTKCTGMNRILFLYVGNPLLKICHTRIFMCQQAVHICVWQYC